MSFTAKYYQFSKKVNSTKQPPAATVTWTSTLELLEPCSVMYPRIVVRRTNAPYPEEPGDFTKDFYNYCYIEEFSRYYWIKSWTYNDGLWIADLECDVLASFKTQIGSTSLYILRASASTNGTIRDTLYPMNSSTTKYHDVQSSYVPGGFNTGVVVLNVAGTNTAGATTLIQFTPGSFSTLINQLYTAINGFQLSDVVSKVVQSFGGNPQSLVNSAMWFPYPFDVTASSNTVKIGSWSATGILNGVISDPVMTIGDYSYTIRKHPKAATRGSYLNLSPYSQYSLGIPGCAVVDLDTSRMVDETKINVYRVMDAFSGKMLVKVNTNTSKQLLAYTSGQIGIPIQLNGSNNGASLVGSTIATVGAVASAIATGGAGAIAAAAASGIGTIEQAIGGTATSTGMGGGACNIMDEPGFLDTTFRDVVNWDVSHFGRPYMSTSTPSALGGYMIASDGEVEIPGTKDEADKINAYMEGGFYYE